MSYRHHHELNISLLDLFSLHQLGRQDENLGAANHLDLVICTQEECLGKQKTAGSDLDLPTSHLHLPQLKSKQFQEGIVSLMDAVSLIRLIFGAHAIILRNTINLRNTKM